ncbi:MAG TPA: hypothetical protein VD713_04060 [Sphingomonadales bacterium]|nr:hypothetical protein [Sphingomonadales bacterium]
MKHARLFILGALAALLFAVFSPALAQGPAAQNIVSITIHADPADPAAVVIKVSPYVLDLTGKGPRQRIRFNLASDTFRFPEDAAKAIRVENNHGQFSGNAHGQGPDFGKVITIMDENSDAALYKYSIEVEDASGQLLTIDPLIKNGG